MNIILAGIATGFLANIIPVFFIRKWVAENCQAGNDYSEKLKKIERLRVSYLDGESIEAHGEDQEQLLDGFWPEDEQGFADFKNSYARKQEQMGALLLASGLAVILIIALQMNNPTNLIIITALATVAIFAGFVALTKDNNLRGYHSSKNCKTRHYKKLKAAIEKTDQKTAEDALFDYFNIFNKMGFETGQGDNLSGYDRMINAHVLQAVKNQQAKDRTHNAQGLRDLVAEMKAKTNEASLIKYSFENAKEKLADLKETSKHSGFKSAMWRFENDLTSKTMYEFLTSDYPDKQDVVYKYIWDMEKEADEIYLKITVGEFQEAEFSRRMARNKILKDPLEDIEQEKEKEADKEAKIAGTKAYQEACETLGLSGEFTKAEFRAAYKKLAKQHHPDLQQEEDKKSAASEMLAKINASKDIINKERQFT